jgi:hypothetical protein
MPGIAEALIRVRERMAEAALRAGRDPNDVQLIAVSKTFPAEAVIEAMQAGQTMFGENRVEEALPKMQDVDGGRKTEDGRPSSVPRPPSVQWHLIGHLQSRKARDAAGNFALIHSVDSLKLARKLSEKLNQPQPILLQCNVSGEASKEGYDLGGWEEAPAKLAAFVDEVMQIAALPHIDVRGLMTIAPIVDAPAMARPVFASLRALRDCLRERVPAANWQHLSMGMSDDMDAAIAEGATLVRVGRAIFGQR